MNFVQNRHETSESSEKRIIVFFHYIYIDLYRNLYEPEF